MDQHQPHRNKSAIDALLAFNPDALEARARQPAAQGTSFERPLLAANPPLADNGDRLQWLWAYAEREMAALRRQLAEEQTLRRNQEKLGEELRARVALDAAALRRTRQDLAAEHSARVAAEREAAGLRLPVGVTPRPASPDRRVAALKEALTDEIRQRNALAAENRRLNVALREATSRQQEVSSRATPPSLPDSMAPLSVRFQQLARVLIVERRARLISEQHLRRLLRAQGIELADKFGVR